MSLTVALRGRSLGPLVKARAFGITPELVVKVVSSGNSSLGPMTKKKVKKKNTGKKAGKKKTGTKKPIDPGQVREQISGMVKSGAKAITAAVIGQAKLGQLAPARYLFEVAKIFPPVNDGEAAPAEEDCFAKTLLARIDAPKKPPATEAGEEDEVVGNESAGNENAAHAESEEESVGAGVNGEGAAPGSGDTVE